MRPLSLAASLVALSAAFVASSCGDDPTKQVASAPPRSPAEGAVADREVRRLYDLASRCDIEHRGVLIDFGTAMVDGRVTTPDGTLMETSEHDGATWSVIGERKFDARFVTTQPGPFFVSARLAPGAARHVAFFVDDVQVGAARLKGEEARVVETKVTELPLDAGEHVLTARFSPARTTAPYADLDWLRIGFPDELKVTFGAPTLDDVLLPGAVLSKVPHRAFSLLAPSIVRCPVRVPAGGRLRTAVGMVGAGEGEVEIAVRTDNEPVVVLGKTAVKGGDDAKWQDLDFSLDPFQDKLVHIELRAPVASKSGRVLFGDPEIIVPTVAPSGSPLAQIVVVVVLGGVSRDELPGYAEKQPPYLERLRKLAERSATFKEHRAPSTVVPATLATMLSGVPPEVHTLTDYGARLPASVAVATDVAHRAGYDVGWFSSVPYSFPAFGLVRSARQKDLISPVQGEGGDSMARAAAWLETTLEKAPDAKIFLFVHPRAGHPPWNVDQKVVDALPPENYTGEISPRRAAQQLAGVRERKRLHQLPPGDQTRLAGLYQAALSDQDRALGTLMDVLDEANVTDRTLIVVTADGSTGLSQLFTQTPPLDDRTLALPLYVAFPGAAHAGSEIEQTTEVVDVARTLFASIGQAPPRAGFGRDLGQVAAGLTYADDEPLIAREGEARSTRWGKWALTRTATGRTRLCDLLLDPTCAFDRRAQNPLAAGALERAFSAYDRRTTAIAAKREPAVIDDETLAALRVWGAMD